MRDIDTTGATRFSPAPSAAELVQILHSDIAPTPPRELWWLPPMTRTGRVLAATSVALLTALAALAVCAVYACALLVDAIATRDQERLAPTVALPSTAALLDAERWPELLADRPDDAVQLLLIRAGALLELGQPADAAAAYAEAAARSSAPMAAGARLAWAQALAACKRQDEAYRVLQTLNAGTLDDNRLAQALQLAAECTPQ